MLAPMVDVIVAIGTCLVLWFGARLVLRGGLTTGALLVFLLYLAKMCKPMKDLSKMTDTLSKAAIAFERVGEIMAIEGAVRDLPGARPARPFAGHIAFVARAVRLRAPTGSCSRTSISRLKRASGRPSSG